MSEDREPFEEDALPAPPRRGDHGGGAGTFFAGLAIGTLLGVGAALFLRSSRGRRMGQYMRDEFDDWREETGRELGRRARRVRQQAGKAARRVGAALEDTFD
ncbi:MAG TPA: hypothetical protein VJN95_16340 [Gemmatimonadales bacterium]|nr:hypothetical protein [Gemmatimonadales bacterium]